MAWFWERKQQPDGSNALREQVETLQKQVERLAQPQDQAVSNALSFGSGDNWLDFAGGVRRSTGLYNVTPESAMRSSAVYACVRLIAGTIAALPVKIYKKRADGERELVRDHPAGRLLAVEPNATLTPMLFWETVVWHLLLRGNGYSVIRRSRNGDPVAIELFEPGMAEAKFARVNGLPRLRYSTVNDEGTRSYDQDDVLHFPCFGWNGLRSFTPIAYAGQNAIGISLAADDYSAAFYGNGARTDLAILYPKKVMKDQSELIQDYWVNSHGGPDAKNWRRPAVLGDDAKIQQLSMTSEDAQLLEARRFQVADIARIFGVPPHLIGETDKATSWGTGIEEQTRGFLVFTLMPHIERIEQELNRKLVREPDMYAEFEIAGLQRADAKTRTEMYKAAIGGTQQPGYMTKNEIRQRENLPPVPGGDVLFEPTPAGSPTTA